MSKLAFDQLVYSTCAYIPVYHTGIGMLRGKSFGEAVEALQEAYIPSVKTSWTVCGPGQFVNFMFVPYHLRVAFLCSIGFLFNTGLAVVASMEQKKEPGRAGA